MGSVPMPAYQPRYMVWPDKLRVDESGLAMVLGMTFALPGLHPGPRSPKRLEQPEIDLAKLPPAKGLEFGFSRAATEGLTGAIFDTGEAILDVRDIPAKKFAVLAEAGNLVEAIPDLARFGERLQVRSQLRCREPMSVHAARSAASGADQSRDTRGTPSRNRLVLEMSKMELRVDYKLSADAPWQHCAVFDLRLAQEFQFDLDRLEFESRVIHVANPTETEIEATGRFARGYKPLDHTLDSDKIVELYREAWGSCRNANRGKGIPLTDRKVGASIFRIDEICCIDPFIVFRRLPAATRIANRTRQPLTYSVRVARSEWSPFYTLAPGQAHDFHTTSPLMFRTATTPDDAIQRLPMGTCFVYGQIDSPSRGQVASASQEPVPAER
jgi:hypothetical protein